MSIAVAVFLLMPTGAPAVSAAESEQCTQNSTPNLYVFVVNASTRSPLVMISVQTNRDGTPSGTVNYQAAGVRLVRMDVHKAFIKDGSGKHEGDDEAAGAVGVGLRGLGYLSTGAVVRVHIDIQDFPASRLHDRSLVTSPDLVRVRWRALDSHEVQDAESEDDCGATWLYDSGWFPVTRLLIQ